MFKFEVAACSSAESLPGLFHRCSHALWPGDADAPRMSAPLPTHCTGQAWHEVFMS